MFDEIVPVERRTDSSQGMVHILLCSHRPVLIETVA